MSPGLGWRGTVLIGIALLLAAGLLDAEPLYVPGVALVVLALAMRAWIGVAASGATVRRRIVSRTVVEDQQLDVRIGARAGRLPFPSGEISDPLLDDPVAVPSGQRQVGFRIGARFSRRGPRHFTPPELTLRDPLGLARRTISGGEPDRVLVLPRVFPIVGVEGSGSIGAVGEELAVMGAAETEIDGIREYRPGSPASRIHWPSLARSQRLMERQMRPEADARPLVVLDARAPSSPEALDQAVRAAASLCRHLAKAGGCCALLPGDRRVTELAEDLAAWPALHNRLAMIQPGPAPALGAAGVRSGAVLYVAAHTPGSRPRGLDRVPAGSYMVLPATEGGQGAVFTVAGCAGFRLAAQRRSVA